MISSPSFLQHQGILHAFGTKANDPLPTRLVVSKQIHGTDILVVTSDSGTEYNGFDALITETKGIAVGVRTADCLPILIVEPQRGLVAAVHAGWRGTIAGIVQKTLNKMVDLGADLDQIAVALGPCIGSRCYEVESDVALQFESTFPEWPEILKRKSEGKWLLNLRETNRQILLEMGVKPERIDQLDLCTHCRPDLFHSYRREGEKAGRMVNFIQLIDI